MLRKFAVIVTQHKCHFLLILGKSMSVTPLYVVLKISTLESTGSLRLMISLLEIIKALANCQN